MRNAYRAEIFGKSKSCIAFVPDSLFKVSPLSMIGEQLPTIAVTPKDVIGLSILFLTLAAIFGLLNSHKVKTLRTNAAHAEAARGAAEQRRVAQARNREPASTPAAATEDKIAEAENKATKADADLAQLQKEKNDLQTRLD